MERSVLILPFLLALVAFLYVVFRSLFRVWIDHRVRMAILEKVEHKPELLRAFEDLEEPVESDPDDGEKLHKTDLTLTGVALTVIGVIFVLVNGVLGKSEWAVGAYFGGVACIVLGFVLCSVGLLVLFLEKSPVLKRKRKNRFRD
jgi:hypothetical protein